MAKGGKSFNDREESAKTRRKVLDCINKVYDGKEEGITQKQWELTLRMATIILPRLNEHTGADGSELFPLPLLAGKSKNGLPRNNSPKETPEAQEED